MRKIGILSGFASLMLGASVAFGLSAVGTPEYAAEQVAISKVRAAYPAYSITTNQVQMRSNHLSISVPTRNRIGNQVNFTCQVRRVTNRDGSYKYEVGQPN